jgi:hypothetical protein
MGAVPVASLKTLERSIQAARLQQRLRWKQRRSNGIGEKMTLSFRYGRWRERIRSDDLRSL